MTVPLWRNLTKLEHRDFSRRFMAFAPEALNIITAEEFYLFSQWLYGRQYGHLATGVIEVEGGAEFVIDAETFEVLRVYPGEKVPFGMLYELLEPRPSKSPQHVRVYMRAVTTPAIKRLHEQYPLAFEALDLATLQDRLADEKRRYRSPVARRQSFIEQLKSKLKGLSHGR